MKIAFANKFFFLKGGQETLMFEEARLLEEMGHEVAFFSMHHPKNPPEYKYYKYFVNYVEFSNIGREYGLFEKLRIAKNFIYSKEAAIKFEEFIKDFQPDVVHCYGIAHQLTSSILPVAKAYGIPVVQTVQDYQLVCPNYTLKISGNEICSDLKCAKGNYWHCVLNKCVKDSLSASVLSAAEMFFQKISGINPKNLDKIRGTSQFLCDTIAKSFYPAEKIVYIPNYMNPAEFQPEYNNEKYFVYIGRLSFEKGLYTLLNAFKYLNDEGNVQAKLLVIGTGPIEYELKAYKAKHNIDNVEFLGFKSGEELKNLFKGSQCMIIPSEWYENAPLSIIEANLTGKPVIGSDLGGIPEMMIEGETGFLFKAFDSESLKSRVLEFIDDEGLSKRFGEKAREFALNKYTDPNRHYQSLMTFFGFSGSLSGEITGEIKR